MSTELCIHIANIVYLASYLCRDILWLRVLTCIGLTFGIIFFCTHSAGMLTPATWMAVFLAVNLIQIVRIVRERQATRLSPEQQVAEHKLLEHFSREKLLNVLTKSMCEKDCRSQLLDPTEDLALSKEQTQFRDLAFDRLSDQELAKLIVRRFWRSIQGRKSCWLTDSSDEDNPAQHEHRQPAPAFYRSIQQRVAALGPNVPAAATTVDTNNQDLPAEAR